jgi:hypothetical protein
MLEFIKMFGLGILYTVLFPFIVAIFALYIVYVFGNYLVLEAINLFGFFFGYSFSVETELEKKLASMRVNSSESGNVAEEFEEFFEQVDVTDDLRGSDNNV